jgi:predicted naringenin-chalcone synthase
MSNFTVPESLSTATPVSVPKTAVALLGIGTALPAHADQTRLAESVADFCCTTNEQKAWMQRVFLRSGVERRGCVLLNNDDELSGIPKFFPSLSASNQRGPSTALRMQRYALEAPVLGHAAAVKALGAARVNPDAITHLISVSCTGFGAPGLDIQLIRRLALKPDVHRLHIGFMGCHAAFNALAAARDAVLADPEALVLVCCVELCTLHFAYGWNTESLVANGLFGDGSAAVVVGRSLPASDAPAGGWRLCATASQLLPESLDAMTWSIGDHGFSMTLSPEVPALIGRHLRSWCDQWLGEHELTVADIKSWAIHPGGPKVLTAAAKALGLENSSLRCSHEILAEHGNMSSTTVLFLLQRLASWEATGPCVALGFGPGLMAEGMLLER